MAAGYKSSSFNQSLIQLRTCWGNGELRQKMLLEAAIGKIAFNRMQRGTLRGNPDIGEPELRALVSLGRHLAAAATFDEFVEKAERDLRLIIE